MAHKAAFQLGLCCLPKYLLTNVPNEKGKIKSLYWSIAAIICHLMHVLRHPCFVFVCNEVCREIVWQCKHLVSYVNIHTDYLNEVNSLWINIMWPRTAIDLLKIQDQRHVNNHFLLFMHLYKASQMLLFLSAILSLTCRFRNTRNTNLRKRLSKQYLNKIPRQFDISLALLVVAFVYLSV